MEFRLGEAQAPLKAAGKSERRGTEVHFLPSKEIFGRIEEMKLPFWADPGKSRPGRINHGDGGRGVYFEDQDGHFLEILTRPYGSGGKSGSTGQ